MPEIFLEESELTVPLTQVTVSWEIQRSPSGILPPSTLQVQLKRNTGGFNKNRTFVKILPETVNRALFSLKGRKMIHSERYEHAKLFCWMYSRLTQGEKVHSRAILKIIQKPPLDFFITKQCEYFGLSILPLRQPQDLVRLC